jgi:glycerophosphoryl diester phosphodiesterase
MIGHKCLFALCHAKRHQSTEKVVICLFNWQTKRNPTKIGTMMKRRFVCISVIGLAIVVVFMVMAIIPAQRTPDHPYFANFNTYPLVIAHADDTGQGLWPGSTMVFLQGSQELGVDVLELDVHMSSDGHIVVMHDDTVDRTTNGAGKISDLTLKGIKSLEVAGSWSNDGGQTYPYLGQELRVPTLAEVFHLFPQIPINIEIKQAEPSMARQLCELIRNFNRTKAVMVSSFSDDALFEFRNSCPEVATAAGSNEARNFVILNFAHLANALTPRYEAFQVPEKSSNIPVVIPRFVTSAHRHNLQVHVWTINDPETMQRYIEMGVDGIMTDRPDLLLELRDSQ